MLYTHGYIVVHFSSLIEKHPTLFPYDKDSTFRPMQGNGLSAKSKKSSGRLRRLGIRLLRQSILWLFFVIASGAFASSIDKDNTHAISISPNPEKSQCIAEPLPAWQKRAYQLSDTRDAWSGQVDQFARNMDTFFAGPNNLAHINESYVRLTLGGQWGEGGNYVDETDIKFRLDLPSTEKKYKLVIENNPEEQESLSDKNRPSLIGNQAEVDSVSAFFQRVKKLDAHWDTKARIGIRGVFDPFVRFDAERDWTLGDAWNVPYRFRVAYFHSGGYKAINTLALQRSINDMLLFEGKTDIAWTQERDTLEAVQTLNLLQQLGPQKGVVYTFGVFEESASYTVVNSYFLSAHYRQLIYKDWLYFNIIPEVNYPREFNYDARTSLTLKLEVFFRQKMP